MHSPGATPDGTPVRLPSPAGEMHFRGTFRRYQQAILEVIGAERGDGRHHLVAPPGAGKTVIGLELVRHFDRPAVVFAPTTTIVGQWLSQLGLFTEAPASLSSGSADRLAPINVFTYQLISTPERANDELRDLAREAWIAELLATGAIDESAAVHRLDEMRRRNPATYDNELAQRATAARRDLLRAEPSTVYGHLHGNARTLVDRLVAAGVGTVVLDECHHLLDYWAIVLRALIGRLDHPEVVGLTATLPDPEDAVAYENYTSLLGDVDYEIPTPAVIKEGDLAPFRDIAWWVRPTEQEQTWLRSVGERFDEMASGIAASATFRDWLAILLPADAPALPGVVEPEFPTWNESGGWPIPETTWHDWALGHAAAVEAILAVAASTGLTIPDAALQLARRADGDHPTMEDWLVLLEHYGLDRLKLSSDGVDHAQLAALRQAIAPFGLTLTERGLHQGRSVVDLTLALSESKASGAADVIAREAAQLGDRLRAVVLTDFERESAGASRAASPLERETGSAFRAFHVLVDDPRTGPLAPVLLTGTTVRTTTAFAELLRDRLVADARHDGLDLAIEIAGQGDGRAELVGSGPDWRPGVYVGLVTRAFQAGETRLLVGTRGLLGEGWDAPALNTLVNLTTVATPTGVAQLHGRALRLDPAWPEKVAHIYDIVCVWPDLKAGRSDFDRLVRRHNALWAIVPPGVKRAGDVVRGMDHVDPVLTEQLLSLRATALLILGRREPWQLVDYAAANGRSELAVSQRAQVRDLWRIGQPYDNTVDWFARLQLDVDGFKTAATVSNTLKAILARLVPGVLLLLVGFRFATAARNPEQLVVGTLLATGVLWLLVNLRPTLKAIRTLLVDQPPDAIVGDAARAVLVALRDSGQVSGRIPLNDIAVDPMPDGTITVSLRTRDAGADSELLMRSLDELFGPLDGARYLIRRDDGRLPNIGLRFLWAPIRAYLARTGRVRAAYLAVPSALGSRRERAEAFAVAWSRWVGGGDLVRATSAEGREVLARARHAQKPLAERALTERWR